MIRSYHTIFIKCWDANCTFNMFIGATKFRKSKFGRRKLGKSNQEGKCCENDYWTTGK